MTARPKHRFWLRCRLYFRRFRIAVWLLILALLAALVYLNQVGLPDMVKKPLLGKLRARGIDLQFSRLRLRWYQGIVAENVRFGRADEPSGPRLTVSEAQVQLDLWALARFRVQVDALVLRQGRLVWPIADPEQAPRQLSVENIQTELRFLPGDQWALDKFRASFAGANIQLSGTLTNASGLRDWKFFRANRATPAGAWQERLRQLADTLDRIHFSAPPELRLDVHGDTRDFQSFRARLMLSAPGAETPWGDVSQGRFSARLSPPSSDDLSRAELVLDAAGAQTRWATATNLHLSIRLASVAGDTNLIRGDLSVAAGQAQTQWGSASNVQFASQWVHALTNPVPLSGQGDLRCERANAPAWGNASRVRLQAHLVRISATNTPPEPDDSWAGWADIRPYLIDWDCHLSGLHSHELALRSLDCQGSWLAPQLSLTNLHARFAQGAIDGDADLNVATRALKARLGSDVDPNGIASALPQDARGWLAQCSWPAPPQLKAEVSLVLPAWTNRQPNWSAEVLPTLGLQGEVSLEHGGAFRQVSFDTAHSHFIYSNLCWRLPDLSATRPEGRIEAEHQADESTRDFYWRVRSTLDVELLRPALEAGQQRALDLFTFTQPPLIEAEIWGRFNEPERIGIKGRVELTNFTFRGESASGLQTALQYTNRVLELTGTRLQRGVEQISADGLLADFTAQKVYLTNGFSTAEPMVVARAIGPNISRVVEPYRFSRPPTARVHGAIPMRGDEGADLHFDIEGGAFQWWKLNLPRAAGHVHWLDKHLELTNVRADFYGGQATGFASFDFEPAEGADYQFSLTASDTLLQALMADLSERTNRLEGRLNTVLVITKANYAQPHNLNGYGSLKLQDGLIWDIPLFGVFSPILDDLMPGLGSSRASAGTCTFVITNAVIRSDDLEIRAPAMRMLYRGAVDLDGRVNATIEAELLRDMWVVGPLVSTVFWPVTKLFEYKVTGTLSQPKTEPVRTISKMLLFPFHPFRSFKDLLPEGAGLNGTNSSSNGPLRQE